MSQRKYDTDWPRLVKDYLPAVLRKPRTLAFLNAMVSPIAFQHRLFLGYRRRVLQDLQIDPSVRVLRYHLNRLFDKGDRIQIVDDRVGEPVRLYTQAENQPVYLPRFLSNRSVDFTVIVPAGGELYDAAIRRFLDQYKLVGTTYEIIYQ